MAEWRKVETLPEHKHGVGPSVIIYCPKENRVCEARAYSDGTFYDPVSTKWGGESEWDGEGATHWMPLPEPPKDEEKTA